MGSNTVLVNMVSVRAALVLLMLVWAPVNRNAWAQAELSGS